VVVRSWRRRRLIVSVVVAALCVTTGPATAWAEGAHHRPSPPHPGAAGIGDRYFPLAGNGGYDVGHYDLDVRYEPASHRLTGVATIRARATQSLSRFDLDLTGLTVRAVSVDHDPATWVRLGTELVITPRHPLRRQRRFTVAVRYDGVPTNLGTVAGGFFPTDDGAIVAGQPDVAARWYPVNDHPLDKASYTFRVTVPRGLGVVANGLPAGQFTRKGWTTHIWQERAPMASYLATIDIGRWDVRTRRTRTGVRIIDAVDPDVHTAADSSLARESEMLDVLQRAFGRYPFDTVGAIVDDLPLGFALETQTRPIIPSYFFTLGMGDIVLVHELAHQWFGDDVALGRWQDIWLNEGFATYAEWLWTEHVGGKTVRQSFEATYAANPATDAFWRLDVADPGIGHLFDPPIYNRGAMALQALRTRVGDRAFFRILRTWAATRSGDNGTTPEFIALAEHISRQRLDDLFHTWLSAQVRPPLPTPAGASS
jgi:aminopeptidase N